jgi:hypothetical protein
MPGHDDGEGTRANLSPSLRAKRSNPERLRRKQELDCFGAMRLAMTI